MGLVWWLMNDAEYSEYYNCSFYSIDSVPLERRRQPIFAIITGALGLTFEILYIPCIYALSRPKVLAASFCYKLMLLMSVYDFITLSISALLSAFYSFNGYVFCHQPRFMYAICCVLHGCWIGYCQAALILALNRCLSFTEYKRYFAGRLQFLWLSIPIGISLCVIFFAHSGAYSSIYNGWFFNPHQGYFEDTQKRYGSSVHLYNNLAFALILPTIYFIFTVHHCLMSRHRTGGMKRSTMALFIQTLIVNISIAIVAIGYAGMQVLPLPQGAVAFSTCLWIIVEGTPPIVYLSINQTIRQIIFNVSGDLVLSTNGVRSKDRAGGDNGKQRRIVSTSRTSCGAEDQSTQRSLVDTIATNNNGKVV